MYKHTLLLCAFPGTGKTYFSRKHKKEVLDSDSSTFNKCYFPKNYIEYIENNIGKKKVICISTHKEVRDALVRNKLGFSLVYPDINLKDEYIARYIARGDSSAFIGMLEGNWDDWILDLKNQKTCHHIVLSEGEFIGTLERFRNKGDLKDDNKGRCGI